MDVPKRETVFWRWLFVVILNWAIVFGVMGYLYAVYQYVFSIGFFKESLLVLIGSIVFSWVLLGNRQHALSVLGHDGGHGLILQNIWWNDFLTNMLTLYPLTASLEQFRHFHFAHHKKPSTHEDPEMLHKKLSSPNYDLPMKGRSSLLFLLLCDITFLNLKELFYFIEMIRPVTFRQARGVFLFWGSIIAVIIYFKLYFLFVFIVLWFWSLATTFWAFFRIRIMTEHVGTPTVHRLRPHFLVKSILFPYNIWCHYEHHAYPHIAAPKLPKIRKSLDANIKEDTFEDLVTSYKHMPNIPSGTPLAEVNVKGIS